ncbi:MAG: HAD family hydrolase [Candidatus Ozemobacteraceae bacterium]
MVLNISAVRAVLFDLDGTLLDSLRDLACSMNTVLSRVGFPEHPVESYKLMVGDGMEMLVMRAMPPEAQKDQAQISTLKQAMEEEYGHRWSETTLPYPGIPELLDELVRRDILLTVLSNKPEPFTRACVSKLLAPWAFAEVIGARHDAPRKPDPKQAIAIARRLGIPPGEFLYLGDTGVDMKTAGGAGMTAIGVLWGFRSADELSRDGATALIEKPAQLLSWISPT